MTLKLRMVHNVQRLSYDEYDMTLNCVQKISQADVTLTKNQWQDCDVGILSDSSKKSSPSRATRPTVYRAVCLFTPQLSLVLIAPTHRGMTRLS